MALKNIAKTIGKHQLNLFFCDQRAHVLYLTTWRSRIKFVSKDKPKTSAADFFPERKSLKAFREAAADCKGCDLWERGTQTVFGEGARRAEVVFVGEQPGNEEDLSGHPFVGPAGRLLDEALPKPALIEVKLTSRTSSNISNGSRVVNVAFIKNRMRARLLLAGHGLKLRLLSSNHKSLFAWVPRPHRHYLVRNSKSPGNGVNLSSQP